MCRGQAPKHELRIRDETCLADRRILSHQASQRDRLVRENGSRILRDKRSYGDSRGGLMRICGDRAQEAHSRHKSQRAQRSRAARHHHSKAVIRKNRQEKSRQMLREQAYDPRTLRHVQQLLQHERSSLQPCLIHQFKIRPYRLKEVGRKGRRPTQQQHPLEQRCRGQTMAPEMGA